MPIPGRWRFYSQLDRDHWYLIKFKFVSSQVTVTWTTQFRLLEHADSISVSKLEEAARKLSEATYWIQEQRGTYLVDLAKYWGDAADMLRRLLGQTPGGK